MHVDGNGPPIRTVGRRRRLSLICGITVALLVAPLVGCGTTSNGSDASGDKAGGDLPAEPVVLQMLNPAGEWESQALVSEVAKVPNGSLRIEAIDHWHEDAADSANREQASIDAVRAGQARSGSLLYGPGTIRASRLSTRWLPRCSSIVPPCRPPCCTATSPPTCLAASTVRG